MRSGGGNWRSCAKRAGSRASSSRGSWSSTGPSSGTRLGPLLQALARSPDGYRRDLARRAAAEVGAGDQDVPGADLLGPAILVAGHAFHRVLAQLLLVQRVDRVLGRDDLVGVDVVAEGPGAAADHGAHAYTSSLPTTSLGCTISPATAEAAATTGLDR